VASGDKKTEYTVVAPGCSVNGKRKGEKVKLTELEAQNLGNRVATAAQLKKIAAAPKKVAERHAQAVKEKEARDAKDPA